METYKLSSNKDVQEHLDDIMKSDPEKYATVQELRKIIFGFEEETFERLMYGGIMFSNDTHGDWGGVYVYKNHVSFEFSKGYLLEDPGKLLEGSGKERRHLKIKNGSDISVKEISELVNQAIKG